MKSGQPCLCRAERNQLEQPEQTIQNQVAPGKYAEARNRHNPWGQPGDDFSLPARQVQKGGGRRRNLFIPRRLLICGC